MPKRVGKAKSAKMHQSTDFEQKITRLHEQLEPAGSLVKWNDKILDPDNPDQTRQIDISIKNNDQTTHIECRIRRAKQDVKWIEELEGRKRSLGIDKIVAVSSSGFTKGALLKANRFGIDTMMLENLDFEEICALAGETITVVLMYYTFLKMDVTFYFAAEGCENESYIIGQVTDSKIINPVFNYVHGFLNSLNLQESVYDLPILLPVSGLVVEGMIINKIAIACKVRASKVTHKVPIVEEYKLLTPSGITKQAIVESVCGFEVIKSSSGAAFTFKPGEIALPENTMLCNRPLIGLGNLYSIAKMSIIDEPMNVTLPIVTCKVEWEK
jgi:hypothetical protein